jgi:hypothetical protein
MDERQRYEQGMKVRRAGCKLGLHLAQEVFAKQDK